MRFWDASALIPLCLQEQQTSLLKKFAQEDEAIVAWWGSAVECLSALARLRREDVLSPAEEEQAQTVLRALMTAWTEVEPSGFIREQAGRVLRLHPLRAADALQLAAALVWCQGRSNSPRLCLSRPTVTGGSSTRGVSYPSTQVVVLVPA
jgi:uncharacterized protein